MSSPLLERPRGARTLFVLAHGAGAGMRHPFMERIATALHGRAVATLRFEFPYMTSGRRRPDPRPVLEDSIVEAVRTAKRARLPLIVGGKSMGGRIASHVVASGAIDVKGLVFIGFPLHPANKPSTKRAEHLTGIRVPMLFLQGTRDALADLALLTPIVKRLPTAEMHVVDDADHGFAVRVRTGRSSADVIEELADVIADFADRFARRRSG
jgi:uncharacterized protein